MASTASLTRLTVSPPAPFFFHLQTLWLGISAAASRLFFRPNGSLCSSLSAIDSGSKARACPSFCLVIFANCLEVLGGDTAGEQVLLRHPLSPPPPPPSRKADTCWARHQPVAMCPDDSSLHTQVSRFLKSVTFFSVDVLPLPSDPFARVCGCLSTLAF